MVEEGLLGKTEVQGEGDLFSTAHRPDETGRIYRRFSPFDIVLHFTMMVTFSALS